MFRIIFPNTGTSTTTALLQNPAFYPQQSSLHPKRQNMYRQHVPL